MKRHVAATLLGVLGLLIMDSHVDWVHHDNGILVEVSGQALDAAMRRCSLIVYVLSRYFSSITQFVKEKYVLS